MCFSSIPTIYITQNYLNCHIKYKLKKKSFEGREEGKERGEKRERQRGKGRSERESVIKKVVLIFIMSKCNFYVFVYIYILYNG